MRKIIALVLLSAALSAAQQNSAKNTRLEYTNDGKLVLPKDYREWVFLSAGIGMTYSSDVTPKANPPFENVFVSPAAYREFMKTGAWPDKTVLLLEVRGSESRVSINKDGRVQAKIIAIEGHVKDSAKGGWAFYGFQNGAQEGTLFPKTAPCYSCHQENGATDTTFVQFYPTLIETAQKYRNYKETDR
jgi:hypothetical protein